MSTRIWCVVRCRMCMLPSGGLIGARRRTTKNNFNLYYRRSTVNMWYGWACRNNFGIYIFSYVCVCVFENMRKGVYWKFQASPMSYVLKWQMRKHQCSGAEKQHGKIENPFIYWWEQYFLEFVPLWMLKWNVIGPFNQIFHSIYRLFMIFSPNCIK